MNRQPPSFSDDDLPEPPPKTPTSPPPRSSRAEILAWIAAVFLFAAVAWVLLFPSLAPQTRAVLSVVCLLLGGAFWVAAYRQLK